MAQIRLWRIVPQVIKTKQGDIEVDVNMSRYFPYHDRRTGELKFGVIRNAPWQVLIQHARWPEDHFWKVRYYDLTGKFSIVYMNQAKPNGIWEPEKPKNIINQDKDLSTDMVEMILRNRIKTTDGRNEIPDEEFVERILTLLIDAAEEARGKKAA